jgi:hypothetical protein
VIICSSRESVTFLVKSILSLYALRNVQSSTYLLLNFWVFYRFSLNTKSKSANLDLFWFWLYDCIFEMGEVGLFSESTVCSRLRLLKMVLERGSSSNLSTSSLVRLRISEIPRAAFRRSSFLFKCSSSSCNLSRLDVLAFKASFVFRWSIVSLSSRSLK